MKVLLYTIDGHPEIVVNSQPMPDAHSVESEFSWMLEHFPQNRPRLLDLPDADVFAALAEIERREMRAAETMPPPVGSEEITQVIAVEAVR